MEEKYEVTTSVFETILSAYVDQHDTHGNEVNAAIIKRDLTFLATKYVGILSDQTNVGGIPWKLLKDSAMRPDYPTQRWFVSTFSQF